MVPTALTRESANFSAQPLLEHALYDNYNFFIIIYIFFAILQKMLPFFYLSIYYLSFSKIFRYLFFYLGLFINLNFLL